jgi:hypothetical protein
MWSLPPSKFINCGIKQHMHSSLHLNISNLRPAGHALPAAQQQHALAGPAVQLFAPHLP